MPSLHALLDDALQAAGWFSLPDGDGWDRSATLGDSGLPLHLALVPLGTDTALAPLVFLASLPAAITPESQPVAAALVGQAAADRVPVGTVVLDDGVVRYRLALDPRLAPHSPERALALAAVGADWAEGALAELVPALVAHGVAFED